MISDETSVPRRRSRRVWIVIGVLSCASCDLCVRESEHAAPSRLGRASFCRVLDGDRGVLANLDSNHHV